MRSVFSPRGAIFAAAAALFLISTTPVLYPEQMVLQRFSSQDPDQQLEDVLYLAAGAALVQAGLSTTREGDAEDYVLSAEYASKDDGTEIQYTFSRTPAANDILADATIDLHVDGGLDSQVGAAVRLLLQAAGIEPVPSAEAKIVGLLPDSPPAIVEAPSRSGEAAATALPEAATAAAAALEAAPAAAVKTPETPPASKGRAASIVKFDSSVSAAGMLFFGALAEFLHYGVGSLVSAGVTWPHASWSLTLGAELSFVRALNDAAVIGGPLSLSTAGLHAQLGTGTSSPYRVAVGVAGGVAAIIVEGTGTPVSKLAPYADAEVQATIPIGRILFLGAEARFLAVFANDVLILAAAPALILRIEL
jgi:hypothetical protein